MVDIQGRLKLILFLVLIFSCGDIFAQSPPETILNFGFGEPNDAEVSNGFLQTSNDGDASNPGEQTTDLSFLGFLDSSFTDIPLAANNASISFSNIQLNNDAQAILLGNGINVISSTTSGGEFRLYDGSNLLLAGDIGESAFNLTEGVDGVARTGNFFGLTAGGATFTGGDLLPFLASSSGQVTLTVTSIETNGISGIQLSGGTIQPFTAALSGQIEARPNPNVETASVPEPTSIPLLVMAFSLLVSSRNRRSDS